MELPVECLGGMEDLETDLPLKTIFELRGAAYVDNLR
jgi:hypothetical protein